MALTPYLGMTKLIIGTPQPHILLNEALEVLSQAETAVETIDFSAATEITLTPAQSTSALLKLTGTTAASTAIVQASPKTWVVFNAASHAVTVKVDGQSSPPAVAAGAANLLVCDGSSVRLATL